MFKKTKEMITDSQLKRKLSANKKLLMMDRKKQKTEHSSSSDNEVEVGSSEKLNVDSGVVEGDKSENVISGSSKKGVRVSRKAKRRHASILRKVIRRSRKKRKMETIDKLKELDEPVDRFSELPEPIIHHIMSFLRSPQDVARITVWSKKWKTIWASFFSFDFEQKKIKASGGYPIDNFITFVDNTLATKLKPMYSVQKFKLSLCETSKKLNLRIDEWLRSVTDKGLKALEIHVEEKKKKHYILPSDVFGAKTLTSLKLYGCNFNSYIDLGLPNLKELSIKNTQLTADVMQKFIQGCPLVEDLRLVHCSGLGRLNILTLYKLSTVELHECHGLKWVKIELPNLTSFLFCGKESWICDIDLTGCANLKYMTLKDPALTDELFQEMIIKFPGLEKVVLRECNRLKQLTILSSKLKELSVFRCKNLEDAMIDVPSLSVLEYVGDKMPFSLMHIANLHEAKLHVQLRKNRSVVTEELLTFLKNFEINGAWKLILNSSNNITIHEKLMEIPHLTSDDIKLQLIKSPMKVKAYVDHLLRMSRPKSLSLVSSSGSDLLKFMKEKIMSRQKNPNCCTYYSKKCWLHHIEDVKMVPTKGTDIRETSQNTLQTTFIFNWKSIDQKN